VLRLHERLTGLEVEVEVEVEVQPIVEPDVLRRHKLVLLSATYSTEKAVTSSVELPRVAPRRLRGDRRIRLRFVADL